MTETSGASPRWTPVANGEFYGSPGCCNAKFCKREDYDRAVEHAAATAAALGEGWSPHVWENLGWHASATKGSISVSVILDRNGFKGGPMHRIVSYSAFSDSRYSGSGKTPFLAICAMRREAEAERDRCERIMEECGDGC